VYDDPEHPDRPTGHVEAPLWTPADRALLLALGMHESTLCPGCGEPKHVAWHSWMDGEYDAPTAVCHACTAQQGRQVAYGQVHRHASDDKVARMPAFVFGETTTEADPPASP